MELRGDGAVLGGVDGLHIRVFKDDVLCEAVIAEGAQVEVEDDEIVFTQNTTEALNLVAYSYGMHFLHEGDEIVISVAEHHSNLVPWQRVAEATGAKLVYMYPGKDGRLTLDELDKKITAKTKLVGIAMVSNVLGLRAPVVKGHGATSAEAVCAGTLSCAAYARANLCEKIAQACEIAG